MFCFLCILCLNNLNIKTHFNRGHGSWKCHFHNLFNFSKETMCPPNICSELRCLQKFLAFCLLVNVNGKFSSLA